MCIPKFSDTCPFYLKLSIALLHILSTSLVIQEFYQQQFQHQQQQQQFQHQHRDQSEEGDVISSFFTSLFFPSSSSAPTIVTNGETEQPPYPPKNWWIQFVLQNTPMTNIFFFLGGFFFSLLPLILSILSVVASLLPSIMKTKSQVNASIFKNKEDSRTDTMEQEKTLTMMISTCFFGIFCIYVCFLTTTRMTDLCCKLILSSRYILFFLSFSP